MNTWEGVGWHLSMEKLDVVHGRRPLSLANLRSHRAAVYELICVVLPLAWKTQQ